MGRGGGDGGWRGRLGRAGDEGRRAGSFSSTSFPGPSASLGQTVYPATVQGANRARLLHIFPIATWYSGPFPMPSASHLSFHSLLKKSVAPTVRLTAQLQIKCADDNFANRSAR